MSGFQTVLFVDTAMSACSVGVCAGGAYLTESERMDHGQAEALLPMVSRVMARAGAGFEDLEAVITTVGPGGFTGLRAGMAAAQGFALARGVPLYGITGFDALRLSLLDEGALCVLIESKRDDFYVQAYGAGVFEAPGRASGEAIVFDAPVRFAGDGVARFLENAGHIPAHYSFDEGLKVPEPEAVLRAFSDEVKRADYFREEPAPLYLREADVSIPKKEGRVLACEQAGVVRDW